MKILVNAESIKRYEARQARDLMSAAIMLRGITNELKQHSVGADVRHSVETVSRHIVGCLRQQPMNYASPKAWEIIKNYDSPNQATGKTKKITRDHVVGGTRAAQEIITDIMDGNAPEDFQEFLKYVKEFIERHLFLFWITRFENNTSVGKGGIKHKCNMTWKEAYIQGGIKELIDMDTGKSVPLSEVIKKHNLPVI